MSPSVSPVISTSLQRLRTLILRSATPLPPAELGRQRLPQRRLLEPEQTPEAEDRLAADGEAIALGLLARGRRHGDRHAERGGVEGVGAAGQQQEQEQRGQRPARQAHRPGTLKV